MIRFPGAAMRRAFWALLVLVHAPALVGVTRSAAGDPASADLTAGLVLVLTVVLFSLKLADVSFLRLPTRRGSLLAFVVAFCLVHHEMALSEAGKAAMDQTPAALISGVLIEGVRRSTQWLRGLRDWLRATQAVGQPLLACNVVAPEQRRAALTAHRGMQGAPRGPPV